MLARILSVLMIALGIGIVVRTIVAGVGGGLGILLGALLVLAGALRLYLSIGLTRG
ncbi:MAG: hypothetical protein ACRDNP_05855 [Gaiellaceae bacterium]